eukprot:TRINITY_DN12018_c0_g1_i3.p2 TRINITY_DN12018_c0_g1~~TRINITY_DN12018_c0_g1_i3.p2  ORF type:complete len:260 (-),score=48.20 TRINITY_DN12018_c0_g1_i3:515-1294(-)
MCIRDSWYGVLQSVGNLSGMIGATLIGAASDRVGRKSAICCCFGVACLGSLCLALGQLHWMLPVLGLVLRRVDRTGSATLLKSYVLDLAEHAPERQASLARSQMVTGIGFACGASVGGWLSQYGASVAALGAGSMSAAAATMAVVWFRAGPATAASGAAICGVKVWKAGWYREGGVVGLLVTRVLLGAAFYLITSTSALYCRDRFGLSTTQYGYLLSYIGLSFSLVNGVVMPPLARTFAAWPLFLTGVICHEGEGEGEG